MEGVSAVNPNSLSPMQQKNEEQHRLDICTAGKWMYDRRFIVACEGNISVRLDEDRVLTTPTCMNKGMLEPQDLVIANLAGRQLAGERRFSSEIAMHLLFYRMRPDVNAICHAHPPTATGFAAAGRSLNQALLPEVIIGLGQIPLVRYATPGTPELSDAMEPFVPHYDALLLANHGAVTCGPDLLTAFFRMETIEHFAKIVLSAELAGDPVLLSSREVAKLMAARARYSVVSPPGGGAELPETSDGGESAGTHVSLTRGELDALIDEAVRKDRARR
ncbi:MAG: class II aldolase/adducin family protein [Candidatus Acidiferrum sp.]